MNFFLPPAVFASSNRPFTFRKGVNAVGADGGGGGCFPAGDAVGEAVADTAAAATSLN